MRNPPRKSTKVPSLAATRPSPSGAPPRGLLLVNLGTPAAPTRGEVRRFLDEFLSDPLVVDLNPFGWWLLRNLLVLPLRSGRVARMYEAIWTPEGSPLLVHGRRLRQALEADLGPGWAVALAMRYGEPSIRGGLDELERAGCREVILAPLFPQVSRSTTGSVEQAVCQELERRPRPPELLSLQPWFADPGYVRAKAQLVREAAGGDLPHCVFSFHGLPLRFVEEGDPYQDHCEATARALAGALELEEGSWTLTYQSRFGREEWLGPATDERVAALAREHPRLLVACPGFAADCLETLEEIHLRLAEGFRAAGGRDLVAVPCLNAHPAWVRALAELVRRTPVGVPADPRAG